MHAGSHIGSGKYVTAPSSLSGVRSQFSTEFDLLGLTGERSAATQQGNPTWSPLIRRLVKGYKADATACNAMPLQCTHSADINCAM